MSLVYTSKSQSIMVLKATIIHKNLKVRVKGYRINFKIRIIKIYSFLAKK